MMVLTTEELTHKKPERALTESMKSTGGRNNLGEITAWHRGGGTQAQIQDHRLQARQAGHSGESRGT
jgi:ribosomal protein L2